MSDDRYDDYLDAVNEVRYLRGKLGLPATPDSRYRPVDDVYEEIRELRSRLIARRAEKAGKS